MEFLSAPCPGPGGGASVGGAAPGGVGGALQGAGRRRYLQQDAARGYPTPKRKKIKKTKKFITCYMDIHSLVIQSCYCPVNIVTIYN